MKIRALRSWGLKMAVIAAAAAALRFLFLEDAPGWFLDEGAYFDTVRNLRRGLFLVGQMRVTFASPYMTAPAGWLLTAAAWMSAAGENMTAFRAISALTGVASVLLIGAIARRLAGARAGWMAAALLAFAPRAVLFHRMAIPYAAGGFWALLAFWSLLELSARGRKNSPAEAARSINIRTLGLRGAAVIAAILAPLNLYYCVVLAPVFCVWAVLDWTASRGGARAGECSRATQRGAGAPKWMLLCAAFSVAAIGAFLFWGKWKFGPAFARDFAALRRDALPGNLEQQVEHWREFLFSWDVLSGAGIAGLLLLRRGAASRAAILAAFAFCHIVLRRLDSQIRWIDYPMMAAYPWLCLGAAALMARGPVKIAHFLGASTRRGAGLAAAIGLAVCLALGARSAICLGAAWRHPWTAPTLSFGMITSLPSAKAAAQYAEQNARKWAKAQSSRLPQSASGAEGIVQTPFGPGVKMASMPSDPIIMASSNLWPLLTLPHCDIHQWMAARRDGVHFFDYDCSGAVAPLLFRAAGTSRPLALPPPRNQAASPASGPASAAPAEPILGAPPGEWVPFFIEDPLTEHRRLPITRPELAPPNSAWVRMAWIIEGVSRTWPEAFRAGDYSVRKAPLK